MQNYNKHYSHLYDKYWSSYSYRIAPLIYEFYLKEKSAKSVNSVLDLCCGTGVLALFFLKKGYKVIGIDVSEHMLFYALQRTKTYIDSGKAQFIQTDVSKFTLNEKFGLIVSTYDSLNHLNDSILLKKTFKCAYNVSERNGIFIFDLNTKKGLKRWNRINISDNENHMIVTRGIFEKDNGRALTMYSGFIKKETGDYERFEQIVYNTSFDIQSVKFWLLEAGWNEISFRKVCNLDIATTNPEEEYRVFIIAKKN